METLHLASLVTRFVIIPLTFVVVVEAVVVEFFLRLVSICEHFEKTVWHAAAATAFKKTRERRVPECLSCFIQEIISEIDDEEFEENEAEEGDPAIFSKNP